MEQVTVKELASEFELKSSLVISELKKIGVWVPSAATTVDTDIANRIRKRLQMMIDAQQEEKEKKEKKAEKPKKKKSTGKVRRSIKELGKPRKRVARKKKEEKKEEEEASSSPLAGSLKPRKGRRSAYRKVDEPPVEEEVPEKTEVSIDDEPLIEKVEATAPLSPAEEAKRYAEELEQQEARAKREEELAKKRAAAEAERKAKAEEEAAAAEKAEVVKVEEEADEPAGALEVQEPIELETKEEEKKPPKKTKRAVAEKRKQKELEQAKAARREKGAEFEEGQPVLFSEKVTVKDFSEKTGVKSNQVIQELMKMGLMASVNQVLGQSIVEKLCETFDIEASFGSFEEVAAAQEERAAPVETDGTETRAPVVTIMGHVDHGKTSLLDYIRKTRVAEGEAGGITQHIGAYHVNYEGKKIVFIDTPGHEAFTRMRARGAQATDIVVLVVAANDGVMPQTLEAIDHAKAAEVPIIVAINKIDLPESQPDRVKQGLSERELIPEDWGGDTVMVEVSAIEGTNVEHLLEMILLVSDLEEYKANPNRSASGVILEAKLDKGRGTVATLLVQNGTLSVGDTFLAGSAYGRVRAMFDDQGEAVESAEPSSAVEVLGLQGVPQAGDVFQVVEDQAKAREMVAFRQEKQREEELAKSAKVSLDDLYAQLEAGETKELPIVLKGDTQGSVEVLEDTLKRLSTPKVKIEVLHKSVGGITESDVLLASASNAIVIGFNVRPDGSAKSAAEHEDVEIRTYSVIYDVAQDIQNAMVGLLDPTIKERYLGRAEVRDTFKVPKAGTVAGCYVQDGVISRNAELRLLRDNVVIYEGQVESLRRFKDDVNEVKSGYECGISIQNFNDVKPGDEIEAFVQEEVAPELT